jgi:hypothetical protein
VLHGLSNSFSRRTSAKILSLAARMRLQSLHLNVTYLPASKSAMLMRSCSLSRKLFGPLSAALALPAKCSRNVVSCSWPVHESASCDDEAWSCCANRVCDKKPTFRQHSLGHRLRHRHRAREHAAVERDGARPRRCCSGCSVQRVVPMEFCSGRSGFGVCAAAVHANSGMVLQKCSLGRI